MLDITGLTKRFETGTVNERVAIRDIDLKLAPGDFVTIIGSNGAGKSTLFGAIGGSFMPDSGKIVLDGRDITFLPQFRRARAIGRLFQDPRAGTAPGMTLAENLTLSYMRGSTGRKPRLGLRKQELEMFRGHLAELDLGLEDRLKTKVGLLSGGQRQAVTLLMATIVPPKLLMLDEHTAALDPTTAEKVLALTEKIVARHKITTLMVTHNITTALQVGNRTIMMDEGRIILDIAGDERKSMTVETVLELFKSKANKALDNDRMILEK